jgi:hypothetical protein
MNTMFSLMPLITSLWPGYGPSYGKLKIMMLYLGFSEWYVWRILSSVIYHYVVWWKSAEVLEEHIIIQEASRGLLDACFMLAFCLTFYSTMKMEQYVPLSSQSTVIRLHGVISQKKELFREDLFQIISWVTQKTRLNW